MKLVKVAAAALNQTPLAWDANRANILQAMNAACEAGVSVLCLPELCISGYGCEDAFQSPGVQKMAEQVLGEILPHTGDLIVSLGLPWFHDRNLYNAACLAVDGRLVGLACKQHLAGDGIHYEPRWFKPWPRGLVATGTVCEENVPAGDVVFESNGLRIGFEICEDAWVAERTGSELAARGVDLILNPSASHFAFGKQDIRRRFVLDGSRAFNVGYVYANLLGNEAGRAIYDGGNMIAQAGQMLAEQPRFSFADVQLTSAVIDIDQTRTGRATRSVAADEETPDQAAPIEFSFSFPTARLETTDVQLPDWEQGQNVKHEEFARAVALGLLDYLRKSRSGGFVVSLSGGADSATVATMVWLLVQLAWRELGRDRLVEKLASVSDVQTAALPEHLVARLLTCVYQASANSSQTTRTAARDVAQAIGARFLELDVEGIISRYTTMVEQAIGRSLDWRQDDLALQNIQARSRSPGVWLLANLTGSLLLATSNRSEAAVGYATMDGDTSGGLSPIAGIDKAFLREWLRWIETTGVAEIGPLPALQAVNVQQPTAELRPPQAGQTDEADLMPYPVLDAIERAAIRDKHAPREVFQFMEVKFPEYTRGQMADWVERFFRLWSRNQWKRERYAPSFHLDDENLDPKTWCRFPILSGGFRRELAELRAWLEEADTPE